MTKHMDSIHRIARAHEVCRAYRVVAGREPAYVEFDGVTIITGPCKREHAARVMSLLSAIPGARRVLADFGDSVRIHCEF